jgi:hypothetical protein
MNKKIEEETKIQKENARTLNHQHKSTGTICGQFQEYDLLTS